MTNVIQPSNNMDTTIDFIAIDRRIPTNTMLGSISHIVHVRQPQLPTSDNRSDTAEHNYII